MIKKTMALMCLTCSVSVNAALIDNGTFTTDTATGFDWMDLNMFEDPNNVGINRTINDVIVNMEEGGDYEGWRYASVAEVIDLFANNIISMPRFISENYLRYSHDNSEVGSILNLLSVPSDVTRFTVITGEKIDDATHSTMLFRHDYRRCSLSYGCTSYEDFIGVDSSVNIAITGQSSTYRSHILVRAPEVPISATVWLFGSALLGLVGFKRK